MEDEDIASTSLIPDTPSPVFNRSKPRLSDGTTIPGLSFLGKRHSSSDLADDEDFLSSSSIRNGLSLPGTSKFAAERQEAVKKKISKQQKSPFTKSKFTLSPCKTAFSYKPTTSTGTSLFENKSNTNSTYMKSPSKLFKEKPPSSSSLSHASRFTDFVKSSSLLDEIPPLLKFHHTGHSDFKKNHLATESCPLNNKAKKRPHTVTAATRWPSSSSSSSDEDITFPKRMKTTNTSSGIRRGGPIRYDGEADDTPSDHVGRSCMLPGASNKDDKLNPKCKKKKKVSLYSIDEGSSASYNLSNNRSNLFTNTNNINDTDSTLRYTDTGSCVKIKKDKTLKSSDKNMFRISDYKETSGTGNNGRHKERDRFHGYTSPKPSSHTPSHLFHHRNLNLSPSQLGIPTYGVDIDTNTSLTSQSNHWMTLTESLPACLRSMDTDASPRGAAGNPIDLTTPDSCTREAIREIKQLQNDEEMARKLQEELDREFAMSLQSNMHQHDHLSSPVLNNPPPHSQTGLHDIDGRMLDQPGLSPTSLDSQRYHLPLHLPGRHRRGVAASRQRRGGHQINDQFLLNLIQHNEDYLNAELGPHAGPGAELDHLWDAPTRRGGRRGRRRGQVIFGVFSPGSNGEDYEHLMNLAEMLGEVRDKGLTKAESSRLPVVTYSKTDKDEIEECNICMSDYMDRDTQKILPCFHTYHAACIDKWLAKNASCPICRVEVKIESM